MYFSASITVPGTEKGLGHDSIQIAGAGGCGERLKQLAAETKAFGSQGGTAPGFQSKYQNT